MNLPNKLTMLRLLLIPFFVALVFLEVGEFAKYNDFIAFGVFAIASFTDFLDGYIARKYNMVIFVKQKTVRKRLSRFPIGYAGKKHIRQHHSRRAADDLCIKSPFVPSVLLYDKNIFRGFDIVGELIIGDCIRVNYSGVTAFLFIPVILYPEQIEIPDHGTSVR